MTRDEIKKVVGIMMITWPNYKPELSNDMISVMHEMLGDLEYLPVCAAVKAYAQADTSGFAPSVGQIRAKLVELTSEQELGDGEAWAILRRAIGRSAYWSQEEFDNLPEVIQEAVGGPETLKGWAVMDEDGLDYARGDFMRRFDTVKARRKERLQLSDDLKRILDNRPKVGMKKQEALTDEIPLQEDRV